DNAGGFWVGCESIARTHTDSRIPLRNRKLKEPGPRIRAFSILGFTLAYSIKLPRSHITRFTTVCIMTCLCHFSAVDTKLTESLALVTNSNTTARMPVPEHGCRQNQESC